eukprot:gnl/TRDRNA2_/TRDRNA2_188493_c0_seq1.p1 gnl/TRDRNA2_/TRDRNA2_188493_c0~~gnl/TRDRNA2_/TRDRNA2_188493_c0_seq1.p1  ORF type:complete len:258 (-),score=35.51 gnl/TRDRNA2_/TRDRNA2_188493_c0_seq1:33-806(-)
MGAMTEITTQREGAAVLLRELLGIVSRLIKTHEVRLALQLLEDWASAPIGMTSLSVTREDLGLALDKFVKTTRNDLQYSNGGNGLEDLASWLSDDGGQSGGKWNFRDRLRVQTPTPNNIQNKDAFDIAGYRDFPQVHVPFVLGDVPSLPEAPRDWSRQSQHRDKLRTAADVTQPPSGPESADNPSTALRIRESEQTDISGRSTEQASRQQADTPRKTRYSAGRWIHDRIRKTLTRKPGWARPWVVEPRVTRYRELMK